MKKLPSRLHHTAYVTKDLEATRAFYEDAIGLPLSATWCETDHLFGKDRTYCHVFFDLADGSSLAFFQFADEEDQKEFGPELPPSPFRHIALNVDKETQRGIEVPVGLRRGPQRHDRRVLLRRSGCRRRCGGAQGEGPCRAEALARRRSQDEQRLPPRRSGLSYLPVPVRSKSEE